MMSELGPEPVYEIETCTCLEKEGDDEKCPKHGDKAAAFLGRSADDPRNEPEHEMDKLADDEAYTRRINQPE